MNKELRSWLLQYMRFDSFEFDSSLNNFVVDLFISDQCNLHCKHCYFGNTIISGPHLSTDDWKMVIASLHAKGIRHFHISGRESSLDNRIIEIVSYIKKLNDTYTGLVSNGTGKLNYYETIIDNGIDYIEFSIDGTESTHNFIRGDNVFSQVINTLESLAKHSDIIDISTCLNKNSIKEYFELIDLCMTFGIRKFFATPFLPKGNGVLLDSLSINLFELSQLIKNSFAYLEKNSRKKLIMKYCIPHEQTYSLIEKSAFFRRLLVSYIENRSELEYSVKDNILQLSIDLLDIKFLHNISITQDGEVIPCSDYICNNNYISYSIGNVLKKDISAIFQNRVESINYNLKSLLK